jgi:hypothetical protein
MYTHVFLFNKGLAIPFPKTLVNQVDSPDNLFGSASLDYLVNFQDEDEIKMAEFLDELKSSVKKRLVAKNESTTKKMPLEESVPSSLTTAENSVSVIDDSDQHSTCSHSNAICPRSQQQIALTISQSATHLRMNASQAIDSTGVLKRLVIAPCRCLRVARWPSRVL